MEVTQEILEKFKKGYIFIRVHKISFSVFAKITQVKLSQDMLTIDIAWCISKKDSSKWKENGIYNFRNIESRYFDEKFYQYEKQKKMRFNLPEGKTAVFYLQDECPVDLESIKHII